MPGTPEERLPYGGTSLFTIQYLKRSAHFSMGSSHCHPYYEMYYLLSGERNYFIKDSIYRVTKGDLVFINNYELHKTTDGMAGPEHERIVIYFRKAFFGEDRYLLEDPYSPFQAGSPVLSLKIHEQTFVENLLHRILAEFAGQGRNYEVHLKILLLELFLYSLRRNETRMGLPAETGKLAHDNVAEIVRFINRHYFRPLSLTFLAEQFYLSPHHLSRVFKRATGFSFVEYLTALRIKEAQRLLRETDRKVSRISEDVGFADVAHFGRVFKRAARCTPLQYRKMYRG
jgi:AraC-like DNA-binding protein